MMRLMAAVCVLAALPSPGAAASDEEGARRAQAWLLAHDAEVPPVVSALFARRLYRVAADPKLLGALEPLTRRRADPAAIFERPEDARRERLYQSVCAGGPGLEELQALLDAREADMLAPGDHPSTRLMRAMYLDRAGVKLKTPLDAMIADYRGGLRGSAEPSNEDLNVATHIVLARAGDFGRYLDARAFPEELAAFKKGLRRLLREPLTLENLDLAAEILVCLKLLKVPSSKEAQQTRRRLLKAQNPDGGWGDGRDSSPETYHAVFLGQLALMRFAPAMRGANPYCDALWAR